MPDPAKSQDNNFKSKQENIRQIFVGLRKLYGFDNLKDIVFVEKKKEFKQLKNEEKNDAVMISANEYIISKEGTNFFYLEYQKKACLSAALQFNIYWLITSSPIIAEFIKQLNYICKAQQL